MQESTNRSYIVPNSVVPEAKKMLAWGKGLELVQEVHKEHGWSWEA